MQGHDNETKNYQDGFIANMTHRIIQKAGQWTLQKIEQLYFEKKIMIVAGETFTHDRIQIVGQIQFF